LSSSFAYQIQSLLCNILSLAFHQRAYLSWVFFTFFQVLF
jgi:hypothetical protein